MEAGRNALSRFLWAPIDFGAGNPVFRVKTGIAVARGVTGKALCLMMR